MHPSEIQQALARPFEPSQIHWRVGATNAKKVQRESGDRNARPTSGIALAYLNSRDVMKRLDDVLGIGGWQCNYTTTGDVLICNIGVHVDGQWIWRANGGSESEAEPEKGKASSAFKRAAVLFGIGRYLYSLPNQWCPLTPRGEIDGEVRLPAWATPQGYDEIMNKRKAA